MIKMKLLVQWIPLVLIVLVSCSSASFTATDNYWITCGSSQNVSIQGRIFIPDSKHSSIKLNSKQNSIFRSNSSVLVPSPLVMSVRVFPVQSSYEFEIKRKGRHWIRLYFYPLPDSNHNLRSASFSVVSDKFVLLNNFNFRSYNSSYLFKEYNLNVTSDSLTLSFIPLNDSIAFVNAIEVVSVPDELVSDTAMAIAPFVTVNGLSDKAMETVYRLNMGGPLVTPQNDTLGRTWENDEKYLHIKNSAVRVSVNPSTIKYRAVVTPEIAPNWVYATAERMGDANTSNSNFNMTWVFSIDTRFSYYIRFHFCDIVSTALNSLVFNVYVNSNLVTSLDLSSITDSLASPYYKDIIFNSSNASDTLSVSVGPDPVAEVKDGILNGLEIMKISNDLGSLNGFLPVEAILPKMNSKKRKTGIIIGLAMGVFTCLVLIALLFYFLFVIRRRKDKNQGHSWLPLPLNANSQTMTRVSVTSQKSGTTTVGRYFAFQEIMDATNKLDESLLLGVGGFGKVYKGTLEDGTIVAVKRGNPRSEQGLAEFRTEIAMLSGLRHRHLVSLIGYCDERSEMILVYEYMANGPLRSHLYGTDIPSLSWKQRLEICIGAARGLHYLHTGAAQSIIHRDVKTTNILLDENFVAKVADFGLSKTGPALDQSHVSTAVKGSFGYLDPEYFRRQQLTDKSDVYSFGVVLMEVLCSRPALNPVLPREQVNIAEWAMSWQKKGLLSQIMDQALVGKVNSASLKKFGETAEKCLSEYGVDRPNMGDVLWNLEYCLQLEETSAAFSEAEDNSTNHIQDISPVQPLDASMNNAAEFGNSGTDDDDATSAVFSQLVNPRGR